MADGSVHILVPFHKSSSSAESNYVKSILWPIASINIINAARYWVAATREFNDLFYILKEIQY